MPIMTWICIICGNETAEGWYNPKSNEGICQNCLKSHSKTELLDYATGN